MRSVLHTRKRGIAALALVVGAVALALWDAPIGGTIDQTDERPAPLGLVGMTEGQLLRVSVASIKGFDPQPDPPGCQLKVGFVDRNGTAIGDPNQIDLRPGASLSFDHLAVGDPTIRQYVRPVVSDVTQKVECRAVVTTELLDRAGLNGIVINFNQPVAPGAFLRK